MRVRDQRKRELRHRCVEARREQIEGIQDFVRSLTGEPGLQHLLHLPIVQAQRCPFEPSVLQCLGQRRPVAAVDPGRDKAPADQQHQSQDGQCQGAATAHGCQQDQDARRCTGCNRAHDAVDRNLGRQSLVWPQGLVEDEEGGCRQRTE